MVSAFEVRSIDDKSFIDADSEFSAIGARRKENAAGRAVDYVSIG